MKNNETISFRFVEGGGCKDCCFDNTPVCIEGLNILTRNPLDCTDGHFEFATPEELTASGIDPREAGVKE